MRAGNCERVASSLSVMNFLHAGCVHPGTKGEGEGGEGSGEGARAPQELHVTNCPPKSCVKICPRAPIKKNQKEILFFVFFSFKQKFILGRRFLNLLRIAFFLHLLRIAACGMAFFLNLLRCLHFLNLLWWSCALFWRPLSLLAAVHICWRSCALFWQPLGLLAAVHIC